MLEPSEIKFPSALDNGAFGFIDEKKNFPFPERGWNRSEARLAREWLDEWKKGLEAFLEFRNKVFVALLDTAVHGKKAFFSKPHRLARIYLTASLHNRSYRIAHELGAEKLIVPVLQGFSIDEYIYAYELYAHEYENSDPSRPSVAVGSVCIRKYSKKAVNELMELYRSLKLRFHLFGLHTSFVRDFIRESKGEFPFSTDSASFNRVASFEAKSIAKALFENTVDEDVREALKPLLPKKTYTKRYSKKFVSRLERMVKQNLDVLYESENYTKQLVLGALVQVLRAKAI